MKDLKHLYYFEKLLEDANNELVREAQAQGKKCVASACENVPEPLLNLPGTFSVRLRAPRTGSIEMATYYTTSFLCEYTRALLERAIEGGFNFTDCLIVPDGCSMLNRCAENMELPSGTMRQSVKLKPPSIARSSSARVYSHRKLVV